MKKKVYICLVVMMIGFISSCEDPFQEVEQEEIIELPASDDDDDGEEKIPGQGNPV